MRMGLVFDEEELDILWDAVHEYRGLCEETGDDARHPLADILDVEEKIGRGQKMLALKKAERRDA